MHSCRQNSPRAFCPTTTHTKAFLPPSLKWGGKFRKARLANQCRVAPLLRALWAGAAPQVSRTDGMNQTGQPGIDTSLLYGFESLIFIPMCLFPNWEMGIVVIFQTADLMSADPKKVQCSELHLKQRSSFGWWWR